MLQAKARQNRYFSDKEALDKHKTEPLFFNAQSGRPGKQNKKIDTPRILSQAALFADASERGAYPFSPLLMDFVGRNSQVKKHV